ncbi:hypothetical protein CPB86DRAFT_774038 [Serendipita vermifera]|nr:hypothetical protein CPB86DRAFT_774038 [Serendipita vermifera]
MLQLDLRPAEGLGPFKLGASLWSILALVRQPQSKTYFPSVNILYDTTSPASSITIVHLHPYIDLLFSGRGQRLHTIAIRRLRHGLPSSPRMVSQSLGMTAGSSASSTRSRGVGGGSSLTLRYKNVIISSPDETLRRSGVMKNFGPTYEGDTMKYPGITFLFEDVAGAAVIRTNRATSPDEQKRTEVKKILITQRGSGDIEADPFDEVTECSVMDGELQTVKLHAHKGIDLYFYPSSPSFTQLSLGESTAEDIRHELGEPSTIYYKEDDRIAIHAPVNNETSSPNSYFMNYFNYGVDFFMDGATHVLKKIIVHSNALGSPFFQRYKRCPWEIVDPSDLKDSVGFSDSLENIKTFLSKYSDASQPMEVDRSEEYEALSLPNYTTRLIGFDGVILEYTLVGQVTSVTLY